MTQCGGSDTWKYMRVAIAFCASDICAVTYVLCDSCAVGQTCLALSNFFPSNHVGRTQREREQEKQTERKRERERERESGSIRIPYILNLLSCDKGADTLKKGDLIDLGGGRRAVCCHGFWVWGLRVGQIHHNRLGLRLSNVVQ